MTDIVACHSPSLQETQPQVDGKTLPLKCPPPNRTSASMPTTEDEEILERMYDESTWNMYYLITSTRARKERRKAALKLKESENGHKSHLVVKGEHKLMLHIGIPQGDNDSLTSYRVSSAQVDDHEREHTPRLVACTDHSDEEEDEETCNDGSLSYDYDSMPFHLDDF